MMFLSHTLLCILITPVFSGQWGLSHPNPNELRNQVGLSPKSTGKNVPYVLFEEGNPNFKQFPYKKIGTRVSSGESDHANQIASIFQALIPQAHLFYGDWKLPETRYIISPKIRFANLSFGFKKKNYYQIENIIHFFKNNNLLGFFAIGNNNGMCSDDFKKSVFNADPDLFRKENFVENILFWAALDDGGWIAGYSDRPNSYWKNRSDIPWNDLELKQLQDNTLCALGNYSIRKPEGGLEEIMGTSFAAPVGLSVAAAILEGHHTLNNAEIKNILLRSAQTTWFIEGSDGYKGDIILPSSTSDTTLEYFNIYWNNLLDENKKKYAVDVKRMNSSKYGRGIVCAKRALLYRTIYVGMGGGNQWDLADKVFQKTVSERENRASRQIQRTWRKKKVSERVKRYSVETRKKAQEMINAFANFESSLEKETLKAWILEERLYALMAELPGRKLSFPSFPNSTEWLEKEILKHKKRLKKARQKAKNGF